MMAQSYAKAPRNEKLGETQNSRIEAVCLSPQVAAVDKTSPLSVVRRV